MKNQALFSSKDKSKIKIKVSSAAILLGALRVKIVFLKNVSIHIKSLFKGNNPEKNLLLWKLILSLYS